MTFEYEHRFAEHEHETIAGGRGSRAPSVSDHDAVRWQAGGWAHIFDLGFLPTNPHDFVESLCFL